MTSVGIEVTLTDQMGQHAEVDEHDLAISRPRVRVPGG